MSINAEQLLKRVDKLFNTVERKNSEASWELISEFMLPNQSGLFTGGTHTGSNVDTVGGSTPGTKKTARLFDSTAIQANRDLAAAINATLTNPATRWAKIRFKSDDLNNDADSNAWLEDAVNKMYEALAESNFDRESAKNYEAYTSLGTMAMIEESKARNEDGGFGGLKFKSWHLSEFSFMEDEEGQADVIYRKFKITGRNALARWGKALPDKITDQVEQNPEREFQFIHCIIPRDPQDVKLNEVGLAPPESRPYASIYIEPIEKVTVEEGGYYELPVFVTRWSTMPSEVYGRGPGHVALPDVRTLNKLKELGLHALAKSIDPTLLVSQRNVLGTLDIRPGQVTVVSDVHNSIVPLQTGARFDITQFVEQSLRDNIRQLFFLDKLLLPPRTETGEMTAFEVSQRIEQVQRVIGPTLGRLNSEFLQPLIIRTFKILLRENVFGELPDAIKESGLDIDVVFINQLARSQQIEDVTNMQTLLQFSGLVAQLKPEAIDYINGDEMIKQASTILGVPQSTVTNDDDVEEIRGQRAQQAQQQQAMEAGVALADIESKTGGQGNGSQ